MGYYSDVALALTANGRAKLQNKLAHTPPGIVKETEALFTYANSHFLDAGTKAEVWLWRDIKWYEDEPQYCPEVCFITELLRELDEEDYRFIRIGEDYDDTEARGEFTENPFDLELARGITLQYN